MTTSVANAIGRLVQKSTRSNANHTLISSRHMSFSFAGPRKLDEVMKTDLIEGKDKIEISDIWLTYHESKERVVGSVASGEKGKLIVERAEKMPFFIQPIFKEDGFFMLLSQFQTPSHFLMAYLEDYKMDPNRAQPLMTFSIFNDLADSHDLSLVRCDIINKGIEENDGRKVLKNMLNAYRIDEDFEKVKTFNEGAASFDFDDYISCMNEKWKGQEGEKVED